MSTPAEQLPEIAVTAQALGPLSADYPSPSNPITQQYLRKFSVVVSGDTGKTIDFASLRCVFRVERGDTQTPNSCDVRIYNLSDATATRLAGNEFTTLTLKAGYAGNYAQIFQGQIIQVRRGRVDAKDSYVDITAADGDEAYNFAPITSAVAIASGQTILGRINSIMNGENISTGPQPTLPNNRLPRGAVLYGAAKDVIRKFAQQQDCIWSIQDGALTLIPKTAYLAAPPVGVSAQTGMIGVPEQTSNGIQIRTLLNPSFKIGTSIKLDGAINQLRYGLSPSQVASNLRTQQQVATNPNGIYYVMWVNHTGDSRGQPWYSDLTCLSVDATIPPQAAILNKLYATNASIPRVL